MSSREQRTPEKFEREIVRVEGADWRLWTIVFAVLMAVASGFVALLAPSLLWRAPNAPHIAYLPQLFGGFSLLVSLFAIYMIDQRVRLMHARRQLLTELLAEFSAAQQSLDPSTHACTLSYLRQILPREVLRSERHGVTFCLASIGIEQLSVIMRQYGSLAGDRLTIVLARQMRNTFRGSDVICRGGRGEFILLMPETTRELAQRAIERLEDAIENWNASGHIEYKLRISYSLAEYRRGDDMWEVLTQIRANRHPFGEPVEAVVGDNQNYLM